MRGKQFYFQVKGEVGSVDPTEMIQENWGSTSQSTGVRREGFLFCFLRDETDSVLTFGLSAQRLTCPEGTAWRL